MVGSVMRNEDGESGRRAVVLDYSRGVARRRELGRWVRTFWSHRARVEMARRASFKEGLGVLAVISGLAGLLMAAQVCLRSFTIHAMGCVSAWAVLRREAVEYWPVAVGGGVAFAAISFGVLVGLLAVCSGIWAGRKKGGEGWSGTFPMLSVGCVPLLWFFVLLQLEGVSPFVGLGGVWYGMWNPVTNVVRFVMLMVGIVLLGVWIVDAGRMYRALGA